MANCSNSASTSRRAASANTCCAAASRRLRPGAHFWRTRSSWSPSTPSRCPRSVSRWDEKVLYVFLVLAHDRRRILHFNVTAHSTAEWTGQQLREAFPFDHLPRYLLCATAMLSSGMPSENRCETWASAKFCLHRAHLGKEPTWSE